jgi:hypothetical protein
VLFLQ